MAALTSLPRRAFIAGLFHETNVFSPIPTNLDSFEIWRPDGRISPPADRDTLGYGAFWQRALQAGVEVAPSLFALCQPSAPLSVADWDRLSGEVLDDLRRAGPVDRVFLFLHGAQCVQGRDDPEGELIAAIRSQVGPRVPIAALMDLHGNVSERMLERADFVIACLEYPHTDFGERAEMAFELLERAVRGEVRPVTAAARLPIVGAYPTTVVPMRDFVAATRAAQQRPGVLAVSAFHGFWLADQPHACACMVVTADGDAAAATALADTLARHFASAAVAPPAGLSAAAAVNEALRIAPTLTRPVVIADRADNAGGGAGSDSTFVLRALLECGARDAALALLWDPMAVDFAHRAGVGARLALRLGGKVGPLSGDPLDVQAEVVLLRTDARQALFARGEPRAALGRTALLRIDGVEVVVNTERQQVFDPRVFTEHGIDPTARRLLVVKSTTHFRNGFAPLASAILDCDTPGSVTTDPALLSYQRLRRPMAPLDAGVVLEPRPLGPYRAPTTAAA